MTLSLADAARALLSVLDDGRLSWSAEDALRDALAAHNDGWRPFAKAPRDGTRFLYWDGIRVCTGRYLLKEYFSSENSTQSAPPPTDWRPMPEPPK